MTLAAAAPVCYFDVTDIVYYAVANARVSGIQRVQLNLIGHLVRCHGGQTVRCMFEHPRKKELFELDPTPLFESDEFQAEIILRRLGLVGSSRIFPSTLSMRNYLRPYSKNKLKRTAVKAEIMLSSFFAPRRLAAMGLRRPNATEMAALPVPLQRIDRLPADACFVNLGATWSLPRITSFVRDHVARGGRLVQVIYDLIPQIHPEYFTRSLADDFNRWLAEIVGYTRRFICISQWTAADLRRFVGPRDGVLIHAVPMAHEFDGFDRFTPVDVSSGEAFEAATMPFVLCVGTLEVRKNGTALLQAWRVLSERLGERLPRLVFAGKQGWLIHEFKATLTTDPDLARNVRIVDSPSDRELAFLYQRCMFAAYPSLYEGWGLPVGEAAWFGKYIISSNATSLPEVCGDLIDYFDPADPEALYSLLERAIVDPEYVRRKERAIAASPMRLWSQVAADMYAFIASLPVRELATAVLDQTTPPCR